MKRYTMHEFEKEFTNDDACLEWIKNHRYPNGIHCPKCDKVTKHHKVKNRPCYECDHCGHQVFPTAGTIFHKSATSLRTWFHAMFQMASTRCGISAKQIQRETGVTYKTAWRMFKQIRSLMGEDGITLDGEVEIDDTYIGGKRQGKRGRGASGKAIVVGMVERQGKVATKVVPDIKRATVMPEIQKRVTMSSVVFTDEFHSYDNLGSGNGYLHYRVNHGEGQYVNGFAHTNTIEGFWSSAKRGIDGVYHSVSPKYLQSYMNEYSYRYNHRTDDQPMFVSLLNQI